MTRTHKITFIVALIILIVFGVYFFIIRDAVPVQAPGEFRGPTSPPSTKGPGDRLPGQ